MDIYNEDDNVISSDEFDEADDLLNVAVSAANPQTEIQIIEPKKSKSMENTKPQKKVIRKLAIKLKKKSIKWMQLRLKRIEIRKRYLDSIARAKCISNSRGGAEFSGQPVESKMEAVEKSMPREDLRREEKRDAKVTQHETIDLDDTDDDDGEDVDDYDEDDDDSSSNSSNKSMNDEINSSNSEDLDETNNDYDEDMDEINNDDDDDDDLDDLKDDEDDDVAEIKKEVDAKEKEIQPVIEGNKIVDNISKNLELTVEEPKEENIPEEIIEQLPITTTNPDIANSTIKEQRESQNQHETLTAVEMTPEPIIMPNHAEKLATIELRAAAECNISKEKNTTNHSATANNNNSDIEILDVSKDLGIEQSFFFNDELNAMYPNFDKIVNDHVTFPETAEIIKDRIQQIAADVEHINKALEIKERECNQLLYVKHTKEQILARLLRKIKRNEVNTDENEIEAIAARELGIAPKPTRLKEPPAKRRKLEPRTAQEIIEHGASMSMDEVLRTKVQNHFDANFIDDTLRKFGISTPKQNAKLKAHAKEMNHAKKKFLNTSLNLSMPRKQSYQQMQRQTNHQHAPSTVHSGQNLLLNLLNNDNDSDDAAVSYDLKKVAPESNLAHLLDNWAVQQRPQTIKQHFNGKTEDVSYEFLREKKAQTKASDFFPILNQSKKTLPNSADETLIVQLDLNDFKEDETPTQKLHGNKANNFVCQYCGIHKAQYVCAECENQWYCSRSCQVKAWDSHCETCE